jgi:hypothetical protein
MASDSSCHKTRTSLLLRFLPQNQSVSSSSTSVPPQDLLFGFVSAMKPREKTDMNRYTHYCSASPPRFCRIGGDIYLGRSDGTNHCRHRHDRPDTWLQSSCAAARVWMLLRGNQYRSFALEWIIAASFHLAIPDLLPESDLFFTNHENYWSFRPADLCAQGTRSSIFHQTCTSCRPGPHSCRHGESVEST